MRLLPSDPDIETIIARIQSGDIDLQPEFQRGEVWSKSKRQRLIDSILRDWHVPPIHVIEVPVSKRQEVLDGQQRLAAIRDFVSGRLELDGRIEPLHPEIGSLHGKIYSELPEKWRRHFNQFTIRVFRIVDYKSAEPAELFYRLNQPTSLTSAEQRNAFFGPVRGQITTLVAELDQRNLGKENLGFSNARMAYDDVLARAALIIERRSLAEKITSSDLADLYRADLPLTNLTIQHLRRSIAMFADATMELELWPRFNKATLLSWLIFLVRNQILRYFDLTPSGFASYLAFFRRLTTGDISRLNVESLFVDSVPLLALIPIYEDRSTARVSDVSSVVLRDAIIWLIHGCFIESSGVPIGSASWLVLLKEAFAGLDRNFDEDQAAKRLIDAGWGKLQ